MDCLFGYEDSQPPYCIKQELCNGKHHVFVQFTHAKNVTQEEYITICDHYLSNMQRKQERNWEIALKIQHKNQETRFARAH